MPMFDPFPFEITHIKGRNIFFVYSEYAPGQDYYVHWYWHNNAREERDYLDRETIKPLWE